MDNVYTAIMENQDSSSFVLTISHESSFCLVDMSLIPDSVFMTLDVGSLLMVVGMAEETNPNRHVIVRATIVKRVDGLDLCFARKAFGHLRGPW
jgi:hypothetical protein